MQRSKSIVTAPWCALYRKQRCSFADSAIYIKVLGQQLNVIHWSVWNRKLWIWSRCSTVLSPQAARGRNQESLCLYGRQRSRSDSVSEASAWSVMNDLIKDLSAWWYRICEILGFLRKVYGILTAQLLITVLIGAVCITVPQVRAAVQGRYVQKALIVVDITHSHINTKSILVISRTHTHTHAYTHTVPCWVLGWSLVRWLFLCCFSSRKIRLQWTTSYSWHLWVSNALPPIHCMWYTA